MLDPDEVAAYEQWKHDKLVSETDISIRAYNIEMEGHALAFDSGVDAAFAGMIVKENAEQVKAKSPYRAKGMKGERRP